MAVPKINLLEKSKEESCRHQAREVLDHAHERHHYGPAYDEGSDVVRWKTSNEDLI